MQEKWPILRPLNDTKMFGYKTIKQRDWDALRATKDALETELKGYYENTEADNAYFRGIAPLLQGEDIPDVFRQLNRAKLKSVYESCGPAYGIVNRIANATGEMFRYLELYDVKKDDYVENHWILDLLNHPNDRFNRKRFGVAWAVNRLVYGDAFVYHPPVAVGKEFGKLEEMYLIPGHRVGIEKGGYRTPMRGIKVKGAGQEEVIGPEQFFESFNYNLDDLSFFGFSPLVAAALYLSVIDRGIKREDTSLKNGGAANIVTPAKDSMGVLPKDKKSVEEELNGMDASGRTVAMRVPVEVHQLGNAPVDLGILESHKEAVTALCFVYDIPVDLYYGQAKYENAKEAKKALYENNAIPLANEFAADLLSHLKLDDQYTLTVNTDRIDVLKDDASDVLDNLSKMHATLNEMRDAYGYEPRPEPWADQPILPMGVMFGGEGMGLDIDESAPTE